MFNSLSISFPIHQQKFGFLWGKEKEEGGGGESQNKTLKHEYI
jgi:hypothetical protein